LIARPDPKLSCTAAIGHRIYGAFRYKGILKLAVQSAGKQVLNIPLLQGIDQVLVFECFNPMQEKIPLKGEG
jgi:hypothetical protein